MARTAIRLVGHEQEASSLEAAPDKTPTPDAPSLDPSAIEQAYLRERARRRAKIAHHEDARNSNARFWVVIAVLLFLTVVIALTAWQQVQTTFGI